MVLTTFSFLQFLYNFQILIKNQESYWLPHFSHFFTTPKSQKFTTTKFSCFVKPTFSLERCCKNQFRHSHAAWEAFFFVIRTQRGSTIFAFCDTSPARRRFFSFFQHLPSENQKNQQNRTSKLWFRRVGAEVAKSKSAANLHLAPSSTIGTRFSNRQKSDKSIQECV